MMENSQALLPLLFFRSLLSGFFAGLIYELFKAVGVVLGLFHSADREKSGRIKAMFSVVYLFFIDALTIVSAAVLSVILIYHSGGSFRGLVYIGIFTGYLIYRVVFQKTAEKIFSFVARILRKITFWAFFIVSRPFAIIFKGIVLIYHLTIGKIIGKIMLKIKKSREDKRLLKKERASEICESCGEPQNAEEDGYVYVGKNNGYKRDGRISFGKRS